MGMTLPPRGFFGAALQTLPRMADNISVGRWTSVVIRPAGSEALMTRFPIGDSRSRFRRGLAAGALLGMAAWCAPAISAQQPTPQPAGQPPAQAQPPVGTVIETAKGGPVDRPPFAYEKGRVEVGDLVTVYYSVGHDQGKNLKPFLEQHLTPGVGKILESEPLHLLSVTDKKDRIQVIDGLLRMLDVPSPQIMIEVTVFEKVINSDIQIGTEGDFFNGHDKPRNPYISQSFNPRDFLLQSVTSPFQGSTLSFFTSRHKPPGLDLRMRLLMERGQARILSKSKIMVESGGTADISTGQRVPIPTLTFAGTQPLRGFNLVDVDLKLKVTAHILGVDFVNLEIHPEVSAVVRFDLFPDVGAVPVIATRKANTSVTVEDGDLVVIGGLVQDRHVTSERGVPVLMDIPFLGYFFKRDEDTTEKTEIVFYLRPFIVAEEGANSVKVDGVYWEDDKRK